MVTLRFLFGAFGRLLLGLRHERRIHFYRRESLRPKEVVHLQGVTPGRELLELRDGHVPHAAVGVEFGSDLRAVPDYGGWVLVSGYVRTTTRSY